ncbi:MAG TPA: TetR/AcrR family transcriptional regulator, partial [Coriobacteriia bacterium]|nr:TetR/AcrR family transcriptional regulator [Coriobacteriia bacterium]
MTPAHPNETRRQELLERIEEIFLAEGFLHTRVGTLADTLHCSRSTLYKLAPSISELYVLILDRWLNR